MASFISHSFQLVNTRGASLKGSIRHSFLWYTLVVITKHEDQALRYAKEIFESQILLITNKLLHVSLVIFIGQNVVTITFI